MPLPKFYDPERIGTLFYPDVAEIARDAEAAGLQPVQRDATKILLLLVDMQVDFCHPKGTLFVPGAQQDVQRSVEFIYQNADKVTTIMCSLDSHYPLQIFHPAWWRNESGRHPAPFTVISAAKVDAGVWQPLYEEEWSRQYVNELQQKAKKQLIIWPYHVPIGGLGNALDPELWSAVFWHSIARQSQPIWLYKGSIAQTEHYSILKPEISVDAPHEQSSVDRMTQLLIEYDYFYIAGEAETHCVLETIKDFAHIFHDQPALLGKIVVLKDCMSAVVHPDIDFHAMAQEEFRKYAAQGIQFIESSDPLPVRGQ
ncbi:hypothetical protein JW998_02720 [candidate division KSB1 bacterium]|nr:hypothetical protein [candidate division KSB1 bacterium]